MNVASTRIWQILINIQPVLRTGIFSKFDADSQTEIWPAVVASPALTTIVDAEIKPPVSFLLAPQYKTHKQEIHDTLRGPG